MDEYNENISLENNLIEPESGKTEDIIFGSDSSSEGGGKAPTGTQSTYHFFIDSGIRIKFHGTYTQSQTYALNSWPHTAVVANAATIGGTMPFTALGKTAISSALNTTSNSNYIDVWYTGRTSITTTASSVVVCGVTIPVNAATATRYTIKSTGTINELNCNTHLSKSAITINTVTCVRRTTGTTHGSSVKNYVISAGTTDIVFNEKPFCVTVTDAENTQYLLQGAKVEIQNYYSLSPGKFYTGNLGYIRAYSSAFTASAYTCTVSRAGYTTQTRVIPFVGKSTTSRTGSTLFRLEKSDYVVPNITKIVSNILIDSSSSVLNDQCYSSSQLLNSSSHFSAVTGSVTAQTVFTGNQVLRYVDIKSILPSKQVLTDEYVFGKEGVITYTTTLKTTNGWYSPTKIYTISGLNTNNSYRVQLPNTKVMVASTLTGGGIACYYEFRLNGSTGSGYVKKVYDEMIITATPLTFTNAACTLGFGVQQPQNATYSVDMYFYIDSIDSASLGGNVAASALAGTYKIYVHTGNGGVVTPVDPPTPSE